MPNPHALRLYMQLSWGTRAIKNLKSLFTSMVKLPRVKKIVIFLSLMKNFKNREDFCSEKVLFPDYPETLEILLQIP